MNKNTNNKTYTRPNYRQLNTCSNCSYGSVFLWYDGSEDLLCSYDRYIKSEPLNNKLDILVEPNCVCDNYKSPS